MYKLTSENIEFIDRYLKNSDVEYVDVRLELTDHIATAIEAEIEKNNTLNFYDAFKTYMILHKKRLLKNNLEYAHQLYNDFILRFISYFIKLDVLLFALSLFFIRHQFNFNLDKESYTKISWIMLLLFAALIAVFFKKERKFSLGANVISFIVFPIYILISNTNPIVALLIIGIALFAQYDFFNRRNKIIKKIGKIGSLGLLILIGILGTALIIYIQNTTKHLINSSVIIAVLCFQIVVWYIVCKMLMEYKKEINKQYNTSLISF